MKTAAALALIGAGVDAGSANTFSEWARSHGKVYNTREELVMRRAIHAANSAKVAAHNAAGRPWTMAMNAFGDLTGEEFKARYASGYRGNKKAAPKMHTKLQDPPVSKDWVNDGAVTGVKDQGQCGSCWSFSTTGSVEGAWFLAGHTLTPLSEQQLVDCSSAQGNMGCNGGLMDQAFSYIIANGGLCTEADYPYTAAQGTCNTTCNKLATLSSFTDVPPQSEAELVSAIAQQPVSVAIEADQSTFQFYSGGVMTDACGTNLDHGVLVVGYGTDATNNNTPFYKIKNSWGASWGEAGYIRIGRGDSYGAAGQCGIQSVPSYPVV